MSGTLFPGANDDNTSLPNPGPNDTENNANQLLNHNYQHSTANDAIKAIEAKIGNSASTPGGAGQIFYSNGPGITTWGYLVVGGDLAGTLPNPTVPGLAGKQPTLVSGLNIKTINGISILGTGDIAIAGGGGAGIILTTSGTSGAATYNVGTGALNIPNYSYTLPTASTSVLGGVKVDGTTVTIASGVISSVAGTTSPLTTKGDLYTFSTVNARLAVGADTFVLTADSTQPTGLKWAAPAATGVTSVSVVSANGFAGTVATATTTPAITLSTTITGIVKGNGTAFAAAVAGTDYVIPSGSITGSAATLTTGRTIQTNLATTTAATFNGSANVTPGVTGTLPVANGGTGVTSSTGTGNAVLSASPALTGTPTAPTAATTDNSTTLATTAFVKSAAGAQSLIFNEVPGGTVNGSNTVFTLASAPATNSLDLYKNGIRLKGGGADYTLSASTITFVTAPPTGAVLLADYNVSNTTFSVGTNSIISDEAPSGTINGANTTYTLTRAYIAGALEVYVNGVKQVRGTHFTETTPASGIFTMGDAPLTGDIVTCNYQFNLNPSSNADTVDGYHANATPTAGQLLPLNSNGQSGEWFEELARVTLGTAAASMASGTIPAKKYLRIIVNAINPGTGSLTVNTRFNGDTGTNYAFRYSQNGGADATATLQTSLASGSSGTSAGVSILHSMDIVNIAAINKMVYYSQTVEMVLGAAAVPDKYDISGKWANASVQITQITTYSAGGATTFAAGSEMIILGHN